MVLKTRGCYPRNGVCPLSFSTDQGSRFSGNTLTWMEDGPRIGHPWAMAEEHYTVLVCRGLKAPIRTLWPRVKQWN